MSNELYKAMQISESNTKKGIDNEVKRIKDDNIYSATGKIEFTLDQIAEMLEKDQESIDRKKLMVFLTTISVNVGAIKGCL